MEKKNYNVAIARENIMLYSNAFTKEITTTTTTKEEDKFKSILTTTIMCNMPSSKLKMTQNTQFYRCDYTLAHFISKRGGNGTVKVSIE